MSNKKDKAINKSLARGAEAAAVLGKDEIGARDPDTGLVPRQQAFVQAFVSGPTAGNLTKSVEIAGYSKKSAPVIGCALMKLPHVSAAIDAALREEIGTALTVEAVAVIRRVIRDENAPLKLRAEVSMKLIDYSGLVQRTQDQKAQDTGLGGKSLGQLSRDDLERIVQQGAAVLKAAAGVSAADNAALIDVTPNKTPQSLAIPDNGRSPN